MIHRRHHLPPTQELRGVLEKALSIHGVARHYGVSNGTARNWPKESGLWETLASPEHQATLKRFISERPTIVRRKRIDSELEERLSDIGDRKLVARAIVDEFYLHYLHKKSVPWESYAFALVLSMFDMAPVLQLGGLMGTQVNMMFRKTKSGVKVPYWFIRVTGYRAFRILQLVRPWLVGQKAYQADIVLKIGPLSKIKVSLEKDAYRKNLLSCVPNLPRKVPASGLREGFRTSLSP